MIIVKIQRLLVEGCKFKILLEIFSVDNSNTNRERKNASILWKLFDTNTSARNLKSDCFFWGNIMGGELNGTGPIRSHNDVIRKSQKSHLLPNHPIMTSASNK